MRVARIGPRTLRLSVLEVPAACGLVVPLDGGAVSGRPAEVHDRIRYEVIYRDHYRKAGPNAPRAMLAPLNPWLVAIGTVMWQGIVQGLTWDVVKVSVGAALSTLQKAGAAPRSPVTKNRKSGHFRLGFPWATYASGRKQRELFVGLERSYRRSKTTGAGPNKALERAVNDKVPRRRLRAAAAQRQRSAVNQWRRGEPSQPGSNP